MSGVKAKGGKKNRKYGRNKAFCERYAKEGREKKNLIRRLRTRIRRNEHLAVVKGRRNPPRKVRPDIGAIKALKELTGTSA